MSRADGAVRLDVALAGRGFARSRSAAAAAIADGQVTVDGRTATRAAERVGPGAVLRLDADAAVGRGGRKLDAALDAFDIHVGGRLALDVGASTGGFTEVLLRRGARRVIALDVGHDQLAPSLRADPRVTSIEGENVRSLDAARLASLSGGAGPPETVVADLSFISLRLVLPALATVAAPDADLVLLIKPQFEVGRERVARGIVRAVEARAEAVRQVLLAAAETGIGVVGLARSPIAGARGNVEALVHLHRARGVGPSEWSAWIEAAVRDLP